MKGESEGWRVWMVRVFLWALLGVCVALGLGLLLGGCATSLMAQAPVSRSTVLALPPATAFQRATGTLTRMGGHVQLYDAANRRVTGLVHGAVLLTVTVDSQSTVEVTGVLLPGKVVLGSMSEVDDYLLLLAKE